MGVGSASVVDYANTYPGTASHVNATGSVGDFEVVVDGSGATTLSLNFQTATSLDPRITFSRTSNATLVGPDGLIQYAPHNLLTYSEQFDNAAWFKRSGSTVNANTLIAPDGTLTADTQTNTDTTTNGTYIRKNGAFAADDTVYCASCYFKQGSQPIASITMYSRLTSGSSLRVLYDLNAGTYTLSNIGSVSGGTAGMEYIGNGWWRVWASANMLTGLDTTGVQFTPSVWAIPSAIGSEYGYIWGAQLNEGALQPYYSTTVKNLLGYSQNFENAAWTKSNSSVLYNLLTYSAQFDNADWTKDATVTITANAITAPDGTTTADTVVYSGASATPSQTIASTTTTYTISTYVKSSNTSFCRLRVSAVGGSATAFSSYFNITTGVVSSTGVATADFGSLLPSITSVGNGWYRISVTFTVLSVVTSITYGVVAAQTSGSASAAGDELYIWGAQLVQSTSPEEYTVTTSASAPIQAVGPFGFAGGEKLVENTANAAHGVNIDVTALPTTIYTVSSYIKAGERTWARIALIDNLGIDGGRAWFDLVNGVVGNVDVQGAGSNITASIVAVGNDWYRCSVSGQMNNSKTTLTSQIRLARSNGDITYTGDGTSGIYIFGAQLSDSASLDPYSYNPVAAPTSTAYYGPRFDYDPATLAPKGLLIEEQRTNLLTYSSEFDNAVWTKADATITANATTAPDGTITADKLVENTATSTHYTLSTYSLTVGTRYTFSVFFKAAGRNQLIIAGGGLSGQGYNPTFDAGTGLVTYAPIGSKLEKFPNNWYRASIPFTASGTLGILLYLGINNSNNYTGDGTSGIYIWGAQLEAGAFPTSYIPTTSATVTRAADNASMVGSNFSSWYNQSAGTFNVNGDIVSNSGNRVYFDVGANGAFGTTAYTVQTSTYVGLLPGSAPVNMTSTVNTTTLTNKIATAMQNNNSTIAVNASLGAVDITCTMPASATTLTVGCSQFGGTFGNYLNGHIQSIKYYPTRLPNGTLQGLTTSGIPGPVIGSTPVSAPVPPPVGPTTIGEAWGGGYYAGKISTTGDGVATHYLIVAPKIGGQTTDAWQTVTSPLGTSSTIDGPTNTNIIYAAGNCPAATFCKGLSIGGYTDWYLPALNELEVLYYNLKPNTSGNVTTVGANPYAVSPEPINTNYTTSNPAQTTSAIFQTGGSEAFTNLTIPYWSSTENATGSSARIVFFNNGNQTTGNKTVSANIRAIRRIPI